MTIQQTQLIKRKRRGGVIPCQKRMWFVNVHVSDIGWLWYFMALPYQNDRVGVNIVYLHDIDYN